VIARVLIVAAAVWASCAGGWSSGKPVAAPGAAPAAAQQAKEGTGDELEMLVAAMSKLHDMDLSAGQLKQLKTMAEQVEPGKAPAAAKASAAYRTALAALRDALAADDDDKIDAAQDRVDALREQEKLPDSPDPEISDSARKQAPAAAALLSLGQVASYVAANEDDIVDPVEQMMDALDQLVDKPGDAEYAGIRSELASEVAVLVAGIDKGAEEPIAKKVAEWLDGARAADPASLDAQRDGYERAARKIVGKSDAFRSLRYWTQREMALLLSNPALPAAIDAAAKTASE
jgi:hypothetical protein